MTTVKDLILALQKFPMNAPVFIYSGVGECDGMVDKVSYDLPMIDHHPEWNEDFIYTPHKCYEDSEAEYCWSCIGPDKAIVFIHSTNTFHDFMNN